MTKKYPHKDSEAAIKSEKDKGIRMHCSFNIWI